MKNITIFLLITIVIAITVLYFICFKNRTANESIKTTKDKKMAEKTLAIIKPDAIQAKNSGKIIDKIEQEGFDIIALKKIHLTKDQAENFYDIHKGKGFFDELVEFVTSGPVIVMVLEKENAINAWRDLMGSTDPMQAASNTIRKLYGTDKGKNATHGSDAPETAKQEIKFFFPEIK